jgi:transposase
MNTRFCGIDISKDSFHAALIDDQGQVLWSQLFPMTSAGFHGLLKALGTSSCLPGMESTGTYYLNLFAFLKERGFDVRLVNPLLIAHFAKRSLRKTKTDKRDAVTIAEFLRANASVLPASSEPANDLRVLARERESISRQIVAVKNEIKRLLMIVFPEIMTLLNPFTRTSLRLLAACPSKDAFLRVPLKSILPLLAGRGPRSHFTPGCLIEAARGSIGLSSPAYEAVLRSKIRLLERLQEELEAMTQQLIEGIQKATPSALALLKSIPGLNDITCAHFLAEVWQRSFANPKKLIAYAGIDPTLNQSGQHKGRGKISKRGNASLRRVLFLMATAAMRRNPSFRELYEKKREEGKAYKQAVLVVAHKLLRVMNAMLRDGTMFQLSAESL